jgi:ureidoglycolate lyase
MDGVTIEKRTLKLEPATAEALKPFGQILGLQSGVAPLKLGFYEDKVEIRKPVDFVSDETTEFTLATIHRREPTVQYIERHFKHTQMFIPLGGKPFVAVMAPPTDGEMPNLDEIRAFYFDGTAGFAMHIGTWHEFPFAIGDNTNVIVVLRGETTRDLRSENVFANEAHGPDLDKKDMVARAKVMFEIELPPG